MPYKQETLDIKVESLWMRLKDVEIGSILRISTEKVRNIRLKLGLVRPDDCYFVPNRRKRKSDEESNVKQIDYDYIEGKIKEIDNELDELEKNIDVDNLDNYMDVKSRMNCLLIKRNSLKSRLNKSENAVYGYKFHDN